MNLCGYDSEECERGVGVGVNDTKMFETLQIVGISEVVDRTFRLRKKPMNLCDSNREEREYGVGPGVNTTKLLEIQSTQ
jgi:hypothetical protein